jgi:predicted metal-dependent hydrolase
MEMELRNQLGELILGSMKEPARHLPLFEFLENYIRLSTEKNNLLIPINQIQPQLTKDLLSRLRETQVFTIEHRFGLQYGYRYEIEYFKQRVQSTVAMMQAYNQTPMPQGLSHIQEGVFKACLLFNHQLYFETHELVEALWLEENGRPKTFLQGIIQVSVAFHHLLYHNYYGAMVLIKEGTEKLRPYLPSESGLDIERFLIDLEPCFRLLGRLDQKTIHKFDLSLIPKMVFRVSNHHPESPNK